MPVHKTTERSEELSLPVHKTTEKIWRITFSCPEQDTERSEELSLPVHKTTERSEELSLPVHKTTEKIWRITYSCPEQDTERSEELPFPFIYGQTLNFHQTALVQAANFHQTAFQTSSGPGGRQRKFARNFLQTSSVLRGTARVISTPTSAVSGRHVSF